MINQTQLEAGPFVFISVILIMCIYEVDGQIKIFNVNQQFHFQQFV
jgi:hypothetical protein